VAESVIDRLRWIKDEYLGRKQVALAKAMGCRKSYVNDLLKGRKHNVGSELLENLVNNLARGTGVTLEWLRTGVGPPTEILRDADFSLNAQGSVQSKRTAALMHKAQVHEYREALLWVISRLSDDQLEKLHGDVRRDERMSHVQQLVVADALFTEERGRKKRAVPKN
jgi:hypothetical protein